MDAVQSKTKSSPPTCSLCGKESERLIFDNITKKDKAYSVYECLACQVWFTHPVPSLENLSELYSTGNYRAKTGKRFIPILEKVIHFLTVRKRDRIKRYANEGQILDIGCGRGLFLNILKQDGWLVTGQEFDEKSAIADVKQFEFLHIHILREYLGVLYRQCASIWSIGTGFFALPRSLAHLASLSLCHCRGGVSGRGRVSTGLRP